MSCRDDPLQLTTWAIDNGCEFNSLKVSAHNQHGDYGLFNTTSCPSTDVDNQQTCLFIPNSLIISIDSISEAAEESEELADTLNTLPSTPTLEPIITVFLLYQLNLQRRRIPTKWSTYIDHLPKSSQLPITWNTQELDFLVQSRNSISRAVPAKLAFLQSIYNTLHHREGWFQSISWDDFLLAEAWVSSRTIECPRTNTPLLVPILDMANHSSLRNAAWEITDEGIELRREPVDISAGEEITISYDLDRGTGERLYRYGFIEDMNLGISSKEITLFGPLVPRVQGGNVFRLTLDSIKDSFRDLTFLTYENWLTVLPLFTESDTTVHKLYLPTDDGRQIRLAVSPPGMDTKYFEIPDLPSLKEALGYGDTFPSARKCVLSTLKIMVDEYLNNIWQPDEDHDFGDLEGMEEYFDVRREVWKLIRICCAQERNSLEAARVVLISEILGSKSVDEDFRE